MESGGYRGQGHEALCTEAPASWPGMKWAGGRSHPQVCVRLEWGERWESTPPRGGARGRNRHRQEWPQGTAIPGWGRRADRHLVGGDGETGRELGPHCQGAGCQGVGSGWGPVGGVEEGCRREQAVLSANTARVRLDHHPAGRAEASTRAGSWGVCSEGRPWKLLGAPGPWPLPVLGSHSSWVGWSQAAPRTGH